MPTIIDSLVVELALDASKFTQGQAAAIQGLRNLEQQLSRVRNQAQQGGGVSGAMQRSLQFIQAPMASLQRAFHAMANTTAPHAPLSQNLSDLGEEGKRSGQDVEAGALAGASGLRALGVAGLVATAAVVGLNKVMTDSIDTAKKLYDTGLGASRAGMDVNQYAAVMIALHMKQNVEQADTGSFLQRITQFRESVARGAPDQEFIKQMGILGLNPLEANLPPEQLMARIASVLGQLSDNTAINRGEAIGMSANLARGLAREGRAGTFASDVEEARKYAPTQGQTAAAERFLKALNALEDAMSNLANIIFDKIEPALTGIVNALRWMVDHVEDIGKGFQLGGVPGAAGTALLGSLPKRPIDILKHWFFGTPLPTDAPAGGGERAPAGVPAGGGSGDLSTAQEAIRLTESASGYNATPIQGHSASGPMQIMPGTFDQYKQGNEQIGNKDDNLRVGNRIVAALWDKYHDWDKVAYAYANGSLEAPNRNPGYVEKFREHFNRLKAAGTLPADPKTRPLNQNDPTGNMMPSGSEALPGWKPGYATWPDAAATGMAIKGTASFPQDLGQTASGNYKIPTDAEMGQMIMQHNAQRAAASSTANDNSVANTTNIHQVNVNVTEAPNYGMGSGVAGMIQDHHIVPMANSGTMGAGG